MQPEKLLFAQLKKMTKDHPHLTIATLRAKAKWKGSLQAKARVRQHRAFSLDELRYLGGHDSGPNPIEHFLAALGGCICILGPALAKDMGIGIRSLEAEVEGNLDVRGFLAEDGVRSRFEVIRTRVKVGTGEPQEQVDRLREEFERRCPFHTLLKDAGTAIDSKWEAVGIRRKGRRSTCPER